MREILEEVDGAIRVPPREFRELGRRWRDLAPRVEEMIDALTRHPDVQGRLRRVFAGLDGSHARLVELTSMADSRDGLREDWERFAERQACELKDWLLGLREIVSSERERIELELLRREIEEATSFDAYRLFDEMRAHGLIKERTWLQLSRVLAGGDWRPSPEVVEALRRIGRIFLELLSLGERDGKG